MEPEQSNRSLEEKVTNNSSGYTTGTILGGPVRASTLCLLIVGMGDLVSSLAWLHAGYGEGNPLFSWLVRTGGSMAFAVGKLVFLAGPIAMLEYARRFRPRTAEYGTWLATLLYLMLLSTHIRTLFGH